MANVPAFPADFLTWQDGGVFAAARKDVAPAVREALASGGLYGWAMLQPVRDAFQGRGTAFGVALGPVQAVVRHARRGGLMRFVSEDRFFSRVPRFVREIALARRLRAAGIATPDVLAGVAYHQGGAHTADVATQRMEGIDLAALLFGDSPPAGARRTEVLGGVGRLMRRLHDAGFVHPDLQLRNVLIGDTDKSIALLDVDTCREINPRDQRARRNNVRRFFRSWNKWNEQHRRRLTADDRAAVVAAYDPALRL